MYGVWTMERKTYEKYIIVKIKKILSEVTGK